MGSNEKVILDAAKEALLVIAKKNPNWRLELGKESLSATQVIDRLKKDKKLKKIVIKQSVTLARIMFEEGSKKLEGNSSPPQV